MKRNPTDTMNNTLVFRRFKKKKYKLWCPQLRTEYGTVACFMVFQIANLCLFAIRKCCAAKRSSHLACRQVAGLGVPNMPALWPSLVCSAWSRIYLYVSSVSGHGPHMPAEHPLCEHCGGAGLWPEVDLHQHWHMLKNSTKTWFKVTFMQLEVLMKDISYSVHNVIIDSLHHCHLFSTPPSQCFDPFPLTLLPSTLPGRIVFAMVPFALTACPNHISFLFLTNCRSVVCWTIAQTALLPISKCVVWIVYCTCEIALCTNTKYICTWFTAKSKKVSESDPHQESTPVFAHLLNGDRDELMSYELTSVPRYLSDANDAQLSSQYTIRSTSHPQRCLISKTFHVYTSLVQFKVYFLAITLWW